MPSRILRKIRDRVRAREYVMTLHADEETDADGFSIVDVENALLTGELLGRQMDRESRERKYLIQGSSADQTADLVVVVKFGLGARHRDCLCQRILELEQSVAPSVERGFAFAP